MPWIADSKLAVVVSTFFIYEICFQLTVDYLCCGSAWPGQASSNNWCKSCESNNNYVPFDWYLSREFKLVQIKQRLSSSVLLQIDQMKQFSNKTCVCRKFSSMDMNGMRTHRQGGWRHIHTLMSFWQITTITVTDVAAYIAPPFYGFARLWCKFSLRRPFFNLMS